MKVLLCDLDGVIIKKGYYFSERFSQTYRVPHADVQAFFRHEFQECLLGVCDTKQALAARLVQWGVQESVDEVMRFWHEHETVLHTELLDEVARLRTTGVRAYITTNNDAYRAQYVWETLPLREAFDDMYASARVHASKPDRVFWERVWHDIACPEKQEVTVWDDDAENVASAIAFGFDASLRETVYV